MDRAAKLPKIQDEEKESKYGYVYAVSGPGTLLFLNLYLFLVPIFLILKIVIFVMHLFKRKLLTTLCVMRLCWECSFTNGKQLC